MGIIYKIEIMKTTLLFCLVSLISFNLTYAGNNKAQKPQSEVARYLSDHLKYPERLLEAKKTGCVFVSFTIDNKGNLLVDTMNSNDPELKSYVADQLARLQIDTSRLRNEDFNKNYLVRLKFQLLS